MSEGRRINEKQIRSQGQWTAGIEFLRCGIAEQYPWLIWLDFLKSILVIYLSHFKKIFLSKVFLKKRKLKSSLVSLTSEKMEFSCIILSDR